MIRFVAREEILSTSANEDITALAQSLDLHPLAAEILYNRGFKTLELARSFLRVDESALIEPSVFSRMALCAERVRSAISKITWRQI